MSNARDFLEPKGLSSALDLVTGDEKPKDWQNPRLPDPHGQKIGVGTRDGRVIVAFVDPIKKLNLSHQEALRLGQLLIRKARIIGANTANNKRSKP